MDEKLRWYQRWGIRLHLLYCVWCRRYAAQVRFLREAARQYAGKLNQATSDALSSEAKTRMQQQLDIAMKEHPTPPADPTATE